MAKEYKNNIFDVIKHLDNNVNDKKCLLLQRNK